MNIEYMGYEIEYRHTIVTRTTYVRMNIDMKLGIYSMHVPYAKKERTLSQAAGMLRAGSAGGRRHKKHSLNMSACSSMLREDAVRCSELQ